MKALLFTAGLLAMLSTCASDSVAVKKVRHRFSVQSGALVRWPEAFASWSACYTLAHAQAPRWQGGVSLGLENFSGWNTVPVAVLVRFDLSRTKPWFLQAAAGRAWARHLPDFRSPAFRGDSGGPAYFIGVGKTLYRSRVEISLVTGYRVQQVSWWEAINFGTRPASSARTDFEQTFRRLAFVLQISWP